MLVGFPGNPDNVEHHTIKQLKKLALSYLGKEYTEPVSQIGASANGFGVEYLLRFQEKLCNLDADVK